MQTTRNILYRLNNQNIAVYIRKKDRKKGWYISGDLAYQEKDGYFWFVSRDDDVIKTSGERVGPFEVESALVSHPKVLSYLAAEDYQLPQLH